MLIRGSFNLYPGLYEPTISRIDGVGACAIIGVPDPQSGDERVLLYVEPDPAAAGLAHATLKRRVEKGVRDGDTRIDVEAQPDEVIVVDQLPRSGRSHKIDRKALRVLAAEGRPS
jgi:acyl-CoA synthetase (AMP-forming)/AMP-acid ligase II